MSTAKPVHLTLSRTQAATIVVALVADVRKWSDDESAVDLLADAWDALEAVAGDDMSWIRGARLPGESRRASLARWYGLRQA